jgi:hypothetical protein
MFQKTRPAKKEVGGGGVKKRKRYPDQKESSRKRTQVLDHELEEGLG